MKTAVFDKTSTNVCKGIAIILMYVHHSFYSADSWSGCDVIFSPLTESQTVWIAQVCKVCVAVFVLLSAYGTYISSAGANGTYSTVVWRRYRKLAGGFLIVYVLTQLFSRLIGIDRIAVYGESRFMRLFYTVIDALGLASAFGTPSYNATWWYMSLAILWIFILPLLAKAVDQIGWGGLPIAILLPRLTGLNSGAVFVRYLPVAILGLLLAKHRIFARAKAYLSGRNILYLAGIMLNGVLIIVAAYSRQRLVDYVFLTETVLAFFICMFCFLALQPIPVLGYIFAFIGKYSMNMFLTHTMIRSASVRLHAFSYAPKRPIWIILLLIADTLVLSIAIEALKKILSVLWCKAVKRFHKPISSMQVS